MHGKPIVVSMRPKLLLSGYTAAYSFSFNVRTPKLIHTGISDPSANPGTKRAPHQHMIVRRIPLDA